MQNMVQGFLRSWGLPIVVLILVNFVYFAPVVFNGKVITQDDIKLGKAKGKEIVDYRKDKGEEALWTNAMFSGMPTFQISTVYPNNVFGYFQKVIATIGGKASSIYIIFSLMLGMFFLLRSYQVSVWLSLIGAIAFGFSTFFIIGLAAGHNAKVRTVAYSAPLIMSVLMAYRGKVLLGFALTSFFLGMSINSNHFQITYYTAIIVVIIGIAYAIKAIREKNLKSYTKTSVLLVIAAVIGVGPNFGNLWSTYTYTQETLRGGASKITNEDQGKEEAKSGLNWDYAMSWSHTKSETFALIIPNFSGGGAKQDYTGEPLYNFIKQRAGKQTADQATGSIMYWGESSGNGAYYIGASIFFLFVLGLSFLTNETKSWIIPCIILSIFLAWGKHFEFFNRLLFEYLPLYNKFRVPSMALVITFILVPFVAILGVHHILEKDLSIEETKKKLLRSFYISGGITLVIALIGPSLFDLAGENDHVFEGQGIDLNLVLDNRASLMRSSAFRSFLFVGAIFAIMWLFVTDKLKKNVLLISLAVLTLIDLWSIDRDQLGENEFESKRKYDIAFNPSDADKTILKDRDIHFRVLNTTVGLTSDSYTSAFHRSIGGYHGAKLTRYQDLITHQLSKGNQACFNMLNAKWFILKNNGRLIAQKNTNTLGNAWFVNDLLWVKSDNDEMESLSSFNPIMTATINEEFKSELPNQQYTFPNSGQGEINLVSYDPKHMIYEYETESNQFAVFSEIFYKKKNQTWKAYIDGELAPHYRVNYLLRGMNIPKGKHRVEFKFEPRTYYLGEKINLTFSILILLILIGSGIFFTKERGTARS